MSVSDLVARLRLISCATVALTAAGFTLAAFLPFIANWAFIYGNWDDPPTGQDPAISRAPQAAADSQGKAKKTELV